MTSETPDNQFTVIIVGAGIAGLTAAHAFQKAGIKHIVIERKATPYPETGAGICLFQHSARVLYQLGVSDEIYRKCAPMDKLTCTYPDGKTIWSHPTFDRHKEFFGVPTICMARRRLMAVLYDKLADKSVLKYGEKVVSVRHRRDDIQVSTDSGRVFTGDLVLGADGAYSVTREFMWQETERLGLPATPAADKTCMRTEWQCIVGIAKPHVNGVGDRDFIITHGNQASLMLLAQPDQVFFFAFMPVDEPFAWPKRRQVDGKDLESALKRIENLNFSETARWKDVWSNRQSFELVNLEEGLLERWHSGRIVLAGDSAHKLTPNIGQGANSSIESITVLTNKLQELLQATPANTRVSAKRLNEALMAYQAQRMPRIQEVVKYSALMTRVHAWADQQSKDFALNVWANQTMDEQLQPFIATVLSAPKLNFLSTDGFPKGARPFEDEKVVAKL